MSAQHGCHMQIVDYRIPTCYSQIKMNDSAIKTDHRAIVATKSDQVIDRKKHHTLISYLPPLPQRHAQLLSGLQSAVLASMCESAKPQEPWNTFYSLAKQWLNEIYPPRSANPYFRTPEMKLLHRYNNRLLHVGRLEEASALISQVGKWSVQINHAQLAGHTFNGSYHPARNRSCDAAVLHNLQLNRRKFKEAVFTCHSGSFDHQPLLPHVTRFSSMNILYLNVTNNVKV